MSIYTPWETTQELYGEAPLDPSTGEPVWWDEEGHPWTEYMFDSSGEEEDEEDLFPSDSEDSESEFDSVGGAMRLSQLSLLKALAEEAAAAGRDVGTRRKESAQQAVHEWMFGPWGHSEAADSDEEQDQELMECSCCGNIWDGKAQCYCMCYGCEKCETTIMEKEIEDEEWDEESLVRETYGRRTYNFGDTKLGPIYVPSEEEANEEHTTMNYF